MGAGGAEPPSPLTLTTGFISNVLLRAPCSNPLSVCVSVSLSVCLSEVTQMFWTNVDDFWRSGSSD